MTGPRKTHRRLSQVETIQLHAVLDLHVKKLPKANPSDAQLCEFEAGWDDERCAKEVAPDLTAVHAAGLRQNIFGKLFAKTETGRTAALEERLANIEVKLIDLTVKHDKLCTALAVNRIHDARHLAVVQPLPKG